MDNKELIKAINAIVEEKDISADIIYEALELALQTAYKKNFNSKTNVHVSIDRDTGKIKVSSYYVVVDDFDDGTVTVDEEGKEVHVEPEINRDAQILLEDAQEIHPDAKVGDTFEEEVTPKDFGRVAASVAKQVVMQKIREAEKNSVIEEFADKQDELMLGMVAMEDQKNYYIDLGRTRGILPKDNIIPGEKIVMGSNIRVYITKVINGAKGPVIRLSRKNYGFVKRLFELEIPEVANGTIVIEKVVREPGVRAKVAVYSTNDRVDAIGSCIGEKGGRIAGILKELNGERLDLVLYDEDPAVFIKNALTPAKDVIVSIPNPEEKKALVIVNEENLPKAIGKKHLNVRLASKLTDYEIEVQTMEEIQKEANQDEENTNA